MTTEVTIIVNDIQDVSAAEVSLALSVQEAISLRDTLANLLSSSVEDTR